jgi:hypothetical protein
LARRRAIRFARISARQAFVSACIWSSLIVRPWSVIAQTASRVLQRADPFEVGASPVEPVPELGHALVVRDLLLLLRESLVLDCALVHLLDGRGTPKLVCRSKGGPHGLVVLRDGRGGFVHLVPLGQRELGLRTLPHRWLRLQVVIRDELAVTVPPWTNAGVDTSYGAGGELSDAAKRGACLCVVSASERGPRVLGYWLGGGLPF